MPSEFYIKRKLFLHNGGHAVCAYLGKGGTYLHLGSHRRPGDLSGGAARDASAKALVAKFGEEIRKNVEDNWTFIPVPNRAQRILRLGWERSRAQLPNDRIGAACSVWSRGGSFAHLQASLQPFDLIRKGTPAPRLCRKI